MSASGEYGLLVIGFGPKMTEVLSPLLNGIEPKLVSTAQEFEQLIDGYSLAPRTTILISQSCEGISHLEAAQALSSSFDGLDIVFVSDDRASFDLAALKKNGFNKSFLLPVDLQNLKDTIDSVKMNRGGIKRKYKAVKLVDLQPDEQLPFSVVTYLSLNKKFVTVSGKGSLSEKKFEKLKSQSINSIYVDEKEIEKFYEYTADKLVNLQNGASNDAVSETEKSERLRNSVREIFVSILDTGKGNDFEQGREIQKMANKVIESFLIKKTGADLRQRLNAILGEGSDFYSHAQSVSTIASLLSMGTGIGKPEDLAIAGLFHDIGIFGVTREVDFRTIKELSEEERTNYFAHPSKSLNLLKEKRITVTPEIAEIIEKHHERSDGTGFPSKLPAHKIPLTAHLLSYADAFEYLTRRRPGETSLTADEAHKLIAKDLGISQEVLSAVRKVIGV